MHSNSQAKSIHIYGILAVALVLLAFLSIRTGAVDIGYTQILHWLTDWNANDTNPGDNIARGVFFQIRLPRTLLCILVGASLSVSGALMQSLFRNPIVEPGLVGTSAGSALGAAFVFVFGKMIFFNHVGFLSQLTLPLFAFMGGLAATWLVYRISSQLGNLNVTSMLLAGIAVNAMCVAGTGFLSYIARDPQARSITFWSLGTFSTADWVSVQIVSVSTIISIFFSFRYAKQLNLLQLGETEATYLGVDVEKLKWRLILVNTFMVAVATSMVGIIGFVGLIVPHALRMINGADNRYLVVGSALLGAATMVLTDMVCRVIIAPAEIPIGIVTAFVGAPVFLALLFGNDRRQLKSGMYV